TVRPRCPARLDRSTALPGNRSSSCSLRRRGVRRHPVLRARSCTFSGEGGRGGVLAGMPDGGPVGGRLREDGGRRTKDGGRRQAEFGFRPSSSVLRRPPAYCPGGSGDWES